MKLFSFSDNLDIVGDKPIKVRASIAMTAQDQEGRHGPFTKGFSPNHNFQGADDRVFFIGQIEVEENEWFYPGETKELYVTFLDARGLRELLTPDRTWRIGEGPRHVGTGTVITVDET